MPTALAVLDARRGIRAAIEVEPHDGTHSARASSRPIAGRFYKHQIDARHLHSSRGSFTLPRKVSTLLNQVADVERGRRASRLDRVLAAYVFSPYQR